MSHNPSGSHQRSATRRTTLRRLLAACLGWVGVAPLAYADSPPSGGMKKRTKLSVKYTDHSENNRTCSNCILYTGDGQCVVVEGEVALGGWCTSWAPTTMGRAGATRPDA